MNDLDAEYMEGLMRAAGWERVEDFAEADAIVINTCAVRGGAEERSMGRLASLKPLKGRRGREGRRPAIVLSGCVAQKEGADLLKRHEHLDAVVGTRDWPRLPEIVERVRSGERLVAIDGIEGPLEREAFAHRRSRVKAFVEIMIGCDNFCSYCIVPHTRGREISRPLSEVVAELEGLARDGYREVTLLGQNVNSWRDGDARLPDLLRAADRIEGLERIRFVTSNPHDLTGELIEAMASLPKVCESLHLPAQAGGDRVLKRMNRRYTRAQYEALAARLREAMPGIVLTTDLMVGFPGETDEDFGETVALLETVRWDGAFTYMYSVREGTAAAREPDDVPREVKQRRVAELIRRQEAIAAEKNAEMKGKVYEVLVEAVSRRDAGEVLGRTRGDKPVVLPGGEDLTGRLVNVEIVETSPHTLRAVPAREAR